MLRKAYTPARLLAEGVLLIAAGMLLFFYPASSLELALLLARWILLLSGLLALLDGLFHLREKQASLTKGLLMLLCAGALFFLPKTLAGSVSLIYGLWTAVNALFKLIYAVQLRRDGQRGVVLNAAEGAVLLVFAVLLFMQPLIGALSLAVLLGIHCVVYGLFALGDGVRELLSLDVKGRRVRQRIRISPPILLTALIPQWLLRMLSDPDEAEETARWTRRVTSDEDATRDLEVFFHLSKDTAMGMGHVDIALGDVVYAYGCYDASSSRLFGLISDGVLVMAEREKYIAYCLRHEKKKLISFGITLTEAQRERVRKAAEDFLEGSQPWQPPADDPQALFARETNATFHKLRKGPFQTYNALKTNCVALADILCGASGLDLMNIQGIVTPGTYYVFLDRQFRRPNSIVISRTVYRDDT